MNRKLIVSLFLMLLFAVVQTASAGLYEGFEDTDGLGLLGNEATITVDSNRIDGVASVELSFEPPDNNRAYGKISKSFLTSPSDMTGLTIKFSVCALTQSKTQSVYLYLYNSDDEYERWRWYQGSLPDNEWTTFTVNQGSGTGASEHSASSGFDPRYVTQIRICLESKNDFAGQTIAARFDNFQAYDSSASRTARLFVGDSLDGMVGIGEHIGKTQKFSNMLVNTTFEEDSAGAGTWDRSVSDVWDEPDIASGINWVPGLSACAKIVNYASWNGSQGGRVTGSSTGAKYAKLDFGSGENTGIYTVMWYQLHQKLTETSGNRYTYTKIFDDAINEATHVTMNTDSSSITVSTGFGTSTLLSEMQDNTWYEFEMTLNYQTKQFDIKTRLAGNSSWAATLNNQSFVVPIKVQ